jgi:purine-binding chemotaxis protein CheW
MTIRKNRKPDPVDWDLIKRRLASVGAALESGFSPGAAQRTAILQARARALAVDHAVPDPGPEIDVLEFLISGDGYALEMRYVQEVHALNGLAPLPCTPAFVRGIVNLHGRILSVIDLLPLFGLPQKPLSATDKLIVLRRTPAVASRDAGGAGDGDRHSARLGRRRDAGTPSAARCEVVVNR